MAKEQLTERKTGRPAVLDPISLTVIWLIPLTKTKNGSEKSPIQIRALSERELSGGHVGWKGWPMKGRYRFEPWEWPTTEWRLATDAERRALENSTALTPSEPPITQVVSKGASLGTSDSQASNGSHPPSAANGSA